MKILLAFEFRKLLNRRLLWIMLALCAAVQLLSGYGAIRHALGGAVGGMKEVYARYDGQVITEDLKVRLLSDYREYAAAHPEEFKPSEAELGYWALDEQIWRRRHGSGVMLAYQDLLYSQTREEIETAWHNASAGLTAGTDADGKPLSPSMRRWYMQLTAQPPYIPTVRYDLGWTLSFGLQNLLDTAMMNIGATMIGYTPIGILLTLLLLFLGLPGFPGERGARMEPVLLTGGLRKTAAYAKILAVTTAAAVAALALCLFKLLQCAATLGLGGWAMPSGSYGLGASHLVSWVINTVAFMLGCAAGAALITAFTAKARDAISALGLAIIVLAAQFALVKLGELTHIYGPQDGWMATLADLTQALPLNAVTVQGAAFGDPTIFQTTMLFALPLVLLTISLLFTPKVYLRRRKS